MWNIFAFNNYCHTKDWGYSDASYWDLSKEFGYDKTYHSLDLKNPIFQQLQAHVQQVERTGLSVAALYTVVDLNEPQTAGTHSILEAVENMAPGSTLEIGLSVGWKTDLSDPKHDERARSLVAHRECLRVAPGWARGYLHIACDHRDCRSRRISAGRIDQRPA